MSSACVHLYVHGRGRGHASRALRVIPALRAEGLRVRIFAGGDAQPWLASLGDVEPIVSLPPGVSARTVILLARRIRAAAQAIAHDDAALVISDGDVPGIWAAALAGRPRIAVGHGVLFDRFHRPRGVSVWPWRRERAKAWLSAALATRCIAVSFCPLDRRDPSAVLARSYDALPPAGRRGGPVLCYFRDGADEAVLRAIATRVPVELFAPRDPWVPGVRWHPLDRDRFGQALLDARCVVGSAGSQLIGECLALGVPLWAIHGDRDDEQRINVELLRGAGAGQGGPRSAIDLAQLEAFVLAPPPVRPPRWSAPDTVAATLAATRELLQVGRAHACAS
jgi:UDP-N-acetylglucosamine--N-acetylmuramyl-(pentapeptide) pyrophosphoryl-undecaprenol N-acetylglucosamine transferase